MDGFIFWMLTLFFAGLGIISLWRARRAGTRRRVRCVKTALVAVGSLGIVFGVCVLAELLQLLVIAAGVTWLARQLYLSKSPIARFLDHQIAKLAEPVIPRTSR